MMMMKKLKDNKLIISVFILPTILTLIFIIVISTQLKPILLETVTFEAEKLESTIVNNAISEILKKGFNTDNLFITVQNNANDIQTVDFNSTEVNKLLSLVTMKIQNDLKYFERGTLEDLGYQSPKWNRKKDLNLRKGIIVEVPVGMVSKNIVVSNLGPKIPVKMHYLGDVNSKISTTVKEYGINNAIIEMKVNVELSAKILLPFITEKITLNTEVPLAIKIIQGKIPSYYGSGFSKDSYLYSIPFE